MKRHKYISLLIILGVAIPIITNAATLSSLAKRPLGGRVIRAGQNVDIACSTISGPIFVRPFNIAVPGPFFIVNPEFQPQTQQLRNVEDELREIRSSFSYKNGDPSQGMKDREKELVEKMKNLRQTVSEIRNTYNMPRSGKLILGNYSLVPDLTTCYNPETGVPIPAFEIKPYGVSR